jgi:undecaprenyl-diphosphatase
MSAKIERFTVNQPQVVLNTPKARAALGLTIVLWAGVGLIYLALVASHQAYSEADLQIARWVRSLDFPGLDATLRAANALTDAHMAIALWIVAGAFFVLRGRPLEAIAVSLISGLWVGDAVMSMVVDRPSPAPELISVVEFSRSASFPSGHVTGAVSFYGLLTFLTLKNVRRGRLRVALPVLSVLVIGLASLGRVYVSAHWPSDILGSYLFGSLGVVGIAWLYTCVKEDRLHRPHLRRKQPVPAFLNGKKVAHSIASTVYLDPRAGTATKEYNPPLPVRALYRLAFQAPFPYQHNRVALEAAAAKRVIVGLLTKHWFGQDMVAEVYEIRESEKGYQFVTEFVSGAEPASNGEIEGTLCELCAAFQAVGLPTWQIAPGNPHAYSNFIQTRQGSLKLIDLESALVSFSYPWTELRAAFRDGYFPVFDDVDFPKLRGYVQTHAHELSESLGREGFSELEGAIKDAERFTQIWKENEPRIWGRLARRVYHILNVSRLFAGVRGRLDDAESTAKAFVSAAIDRWERDGHIDGEQATSLRYMTSTSEVETLLKHLGAHLVLTVAIAIPIPGLRSAARFLWTLSFRLKALYARGRGRMTREEYRVARSIHSVQVMLLALVPALGAMAYAVSDTMVKRGLGRMLLDQSAHKIPFGLYGRLRLARITAPRSLGPGASLRTTAGTAARRVSRAAVDWAEGFSLTDAVAEPLPVRVGGRERQLPSTDVRAKLVCVSPDARWHNEYAITMSTGQIPWRYGGGPWTLLEPPGFTNSDIPYEEVADPVQL